ncbi:MAG TPA: NADP-dependent isocitrate dehydrogenase [Bellilinea sp.]|nr:NADP-dependent isocitrate dehydrogenase [Bellilinea sp.]
MQSKQRITVAQGDGIGPEIMRAVLEVLNAAGAPLEYDPIEIGEQVYLKGITTGIPAEAWDVIRRNRVVLKAPITTPLGGGYKSINVTLRKSLGLFANVRPCKAYTPFVASSFPKMDLVVVRENEEDLYGGIEYQQTREVTQSLKLISAPGSESIIRYAFEYARAYGRKRVTCMTKDNIMKIADGLFHRIFTAIAAEYPEIEADHQIIDIGTARVAAAPDKLDVVVTLNLYGDILSDVAAQVAGSVGLAGSANVGRDAAMFEAIHGSAPDIAGQGIANPSGLLQAAIQMLVHLGLAETAERINNAWLCTLEDGIHTADIYQPATSRERVSTQEFGAAVIDRLGKTPQQLQPSHFAGGQLQVNLRPAAAVKKELVGVDVFVDWDQPGRNADTLGALVSALNGGGLTLGLITNRGVRVYPDGLPETFCSDHWRCRFTADQSALTHAQINALLARFDQAGLDVIKTENLYTFDGKRGYTLAQGE